MTEWLKWDDGITNPSQNQDAIWLYVDSPDYVRNDGEFACKFWREDDAIHVLTPDEQGEFVRTEQYTLSAESIDIIAEKYDILWGKWMVFRTPDVVDDTWLKVAHWVGAGRLGPSAKVATAKSIELENKNEYLICIYTLDYLDESDVMKIRGVLRELGVIERLYYKPDIYTYLRIYRGKTSIKASRYSA